MSSTTTSAEAQAHKTASRAKKSPARSANGKAAPKKSSGELTPWREAYLAGLGLVDLLGEQFWDIEKDLVKRGQKRASALEKTTKKWRLDAKKQYKEVRENVEEEYHRILEKVGLEQTA